MLLKIGAIVLAVVLALWLFNDWLIELFERKERPELLGCVVCNVPLPNGVWICDRCFEAGAKGAEPEVGPC